MTVYTVKAGVYVSSTSRNTARHIARASDGTLWCVYTRLNDADSDLAIHYATSTDDGVTWTEGGEVNDQAGVIGNGDRGWQLNPGIAIDSNDNVYVVWNGEGWGTYVTKEQIQYKKFTAGGSWGSQVAVTDVNFDQTDPCIAIDSNDDVHIAWHGTGWDTYTAKSQIEYIKVGGSREAVTDVNEDQSFASIAIDSDDYVHLSWRGAGVYYRKRTNSWQTQETVANNAQVQNHPCIAVDDDGTPHVIWSGLGWGDQSGSYNIKYKERPDSSWTGNPEDVTDDSVDKHGASLALNANGDIYAVFYDSTGTSESWQVKRGVSSWPAATLINESEHPNLLWAYHPISGGVQPNVPYSGYGALVTGFPSTYDAEFDNGTLVFLTTPSVRTDAATSISETAATMNGTLTDDGGAGCTVGFEWGRSTSYGNTEIAGYGVTTTTSFALADNDLLPNTLYHFRAYATNTAGTGYGADLTFMTQTPIQGGGTPIGAVGTLRHTWEEGEYKLEIGIGAVGKAVRTLPKIDYEDPDPMSEPELIGRLLSLEWLFGSLRLGDIEGKLAALEGYFGPLSSPYGVSRSPNINVIHRYNPVLGIPAGPYLSALRALLVSRSSPEHGYIPSRSDEPTGQLLNWYFLDGGDADANFDMLDVIARDIIDGGTLSGIIPAMNYIDIDNETLTADGGAL